MDFKRSPASNSPIHRPSIFSLEIVQCSYGNRNRGRLLSAGPRVGLFKCRFILDYEQKMHTSSRVMETNPPGANRPLTNLAQSCSYSVKASRATLLFWVTSNFKSNTIMVEIESVTILCFYKKVSKKTVVLIWICYQEIFFSRKVGGRLPNKKGRRSGWSLAKPEFAKIKVEQKRVNVVLQDL